MNINKVLFVVSVVLFVSFIILGFVSMFFFETVIKPCVDGRNAPNINGLLCEYEINTFLPTESFMLLSFISGVMSILTFTSWVGEE